MGAAVCPACGREFGCGVDEGSCWCARVELERERAIALARDHHDCLCPDCIADRAGQPLAVRRRRES